MLDKNPFQIDRFGGINRGSESTQFSIEYQDTVPFSDALDCENLIFTRDGGVQTRPPSKKKQDFFRELPPTKDFSGGPRQHWKIGRLGTTYYDNRWLYLTFDSTTNIGRIYDSGNITGPIYAPLKKITGMRFASVINIYGRLYISPLSDVGEPLTGSDGVIWLYDGTTFRKAGGTAPVGATLAITDTAVGGANVTPGLHIGAIAFETDSGFITPAGPATRIQVTIAATGGRAARFTNVDTGPAGTVARHLLLTKSIPTYDGIQDNWELFFALRIPDNVTTTGDVVLPDTGLVDSADYLLSEKSSLPSCSYISTYGAHLMYNGINTDKRVIYVSKGSDPETVDETEDYIQSFDGIPVDVLIGKELRGAYYFFKENCGFTVQETSDPPNTWRIDIIDSGIGVSPFGIAEVLANPGSLVLDNLITCGESGIYVFSGAFSHIPISDKITGFWKKLTKDEILYTRMSVDSVRKRLYVLTKGDWNSDDGITPNNPFELWVADYVQGLDPQNIRWTRWAMYYEAG